MCYGILGRKAASISELVSSDSLQKPGRENQRAAQHLYSLISLTSPTPPTRAPWEPHVVPVSRCAWSTGQDPWQTHTCKRKCCALWPWPQEKPPGPSRGEASCSQKPQVLPARPAGPRGTGRLYTPSYLL